MADAKRKLMIEILSDAKGVRTGFGEADQAAGKFGTSMKKVAATAAGLVSVGLAVDLVKDSLHEAVKDEQSVTQLANQMKNLGIPAKDQKSVENYITKLSLMRGVADDELRPAFAQLIRSYGDTAKAQDALSLAQDIAAAKGISVAAAADILAKAHNGQTRGLKTLGIGLEDVNGKALTQEQIFAKLKTTFEGAGETAANTGEGKLRKMSVAFDEMKEKIGTALLPIMVKLVDWITISLIPAIEATVKWLQENFPKGVKAIQDAFDKIWPILENFIEVFKGVFKTVKAVFDVFADIFHGDWSKLWGDLLDIFTGLGQAITGAVGALWEQLKLLAETAGKAILNAWLAGMQSVWDNILYPWFAGIPLKILDTLKDANLWLVGKGKDLLLGLVHGVEDGFSDLFTWFFNLPSRLKQMFVDAAQWLVDVGRDIVKGIIAGIKAAPSAIRDAIIDLVPGGASTVDKILKYIPFGGAFAEGGIVPGPKGSPVAIVAHGGEYVVPNGGRVGSGTVNNITINLSDMDGSKLIAVIKQYTQQNGSGWMAA